MLFRLLGGNLTLESAIIQIFVILFVVFLILPIHEFAHAGMAYALGDKAIKYRGRLTFNPLAHVDPMGALCLLLFGFGWAKPVPINPNNFKNPKWGMALSAFAGPLSNLACGLISGFSLFVILNFAPQTLSSKWGFYLILFLFNFLAINVSLAVFNLIPFPPLDGSKILFAFFPDKAYNFMMRFERYSFILIYAVVILLSRSGLLDIVDNFFMKLCLFNDPVCLYVFGLG